MRKKPDSGLAVQYIRMSSDVQNELLSFGAQKRHMDEYCESKGLTVAATFREVGSGLDTAILPVFLDTVAYAISPANNICHIVFYDLSRFTRAKEEFWTYLQIFDNNDIIAHSTVEGASTDENADLLWGIKNVLNYEYSKNISRLTINGQDEATKLGFIMSRITPYGYERYYEVVIEKGKEKSHPRLRPHPEQAKHVVMMFQMRAEGRRPAAIAKQLKLLGVLSPTGKPEWPENTISHILTNNVYRGWMEFGETSRSKIPAHRRNRVKVVCINAHKRLVEDNPFRHVQELMRQARRPQTDSPRSSSSPNPISERIKCGECRKKGRDSNMVIRYKRTPGAPIMLTCRTKKNKGTKFCNKEDVPLYEVLEDIVFTMLNQVLTEDELNYQVDSFATESSPLAKEKRAQQAALRKRGKEISSQIKNQMHNLRQTKEGDLSRAAKRIIEDIDELDEELEKVQGQIQDLKEDTDEFAALLSDRDEIIAAAMESRTYLEAEDEDLAKQFLNEMIQKVYFYDNNQAEMFYSIPVPGTEKTAEGYKGPAVSSHGGILLEQYGPSPFGWDFLHPVKGPGYLTVYGAGSIGVVAQVHHPEGALTEATGMVESPQHRLQRVHHVTRSSNLGHIPVLERPASDGCDVRTKRIPLPVALNSAVEG